MDSTSFSLLRRLQSDTREGAWVRFVELYAPLIYYWGRQQGLDPTDSADLVQEVMTVLVVKLPEFKYDPNRRFRGWLRTVTINKARDMHRRNAVRPQAGWEGSGIQPVVESEADLFAEREYRRFLAQRALQLMKSEFDPQSWQACWKHVVDGQKAASVANELGITVNMVYLAKSRILAHLRHELEGLVE